MNNPINEPENYEADLISLIDDDGNEYEFEILAELDYNESHYYALGPLFDLEDEDMDPENTYMIFEAVEDDSGEPQLAEVDDESLLDELSECFQDIFDKNISDSENEE